MRFAPSLLAGLCVAACAARPIPPTVASTPATPRPTVSADTWIVPSPDDPRGTASLVALARPGTAFLDDGNFVLPSDDGSPAFASLTRDGSLRSHAPHALAARDCALRPASNGVVRVCPGPAEGSVTAAWIDRTAVVPIPAPVPPELFVDPAGESVAVDGRCSPDEADDGITFCWLRRDLRQWTEWTAPRRATLLALRGETALLNESSDTTAALSVFVITASHRTAIEPTDPTLVLDAAGFTPTGSVVVLAHRAAPADSRAPVESFVCVASAGVPCTARPLSIAAVDVAFADGLRGLAVGANASALAITTDGGASWQPILPSGHPAPASVSLPAPAAPSPGRRARIRPAGELVRCNANACAAGRVVHRWNAD
jgi:hypothetical protein